MSLAALSIYPPPPLPPKPEVKDLNYMDDSEKEEEEDLLPPKPIEEFRLKYLDVAINATSDTAKWARDHIKESDI